MSSPIVPEHGNVSWHLIARLVLRLILGVGVVLGAYALIPLGQDGWWSAALPSLIIGTAIFSFVFIRGLRGIVSAEHPAIRAVEALTMTLLVVIVIFATLAVEIEAQSPGSYSEPLTKLDGIYFSVTTLATVGYGDITPVTQYARGVGIAQMLANLAVLGLAVRLLTSALNRSQARRAKEASPE